MPDLSSDAVVVAGVGSITSCLTVTGFAASFAVDSGLNVSSKIEAVFAMSEGTDGVNAVELGVNSGAGVASLADGFRSSSTS